MSAPREMVIGDLLNLDMLKEAIEVEFIGTLWVKGDSGPMTPYVCETNCGDTCCTCRTDYETREDWPCIEADDGCAWGFIRWDWLMKTIGGTAADCLPRTWADIHLAHLTHPTPPPRQASRPALPHEGMTSL